MKTIRRLGKLVLGAHPVPQPNPEFQELIRRRWYLPMYLRARAQAGDIADLAAEARSFCLFVGFPRSGHSIYGALLDAHRNIAIAHELDVLGLLDAGFDERQLYQLILRNSEDFAHIGRGWSGYSYKVAGGHQGRYEALYVLGDKKAAASSTRLLRKPGLLDELEQILSIPLRLIVYYRNPFDIVGSMTRHLKAHEAQERSIRFCLRVFGLLDWLRNNRSSDEIIEVYHEDFLKTPASSLSSTIARLGATVDERYLENVTSIVRRSPSLSRNRIEWPREAIEAIELSIQRYPFLARYSFSD
jgi:hypothetical protein